jgi:uroporphyrinogen decarboxylase
MGFPQRAPLGDFPAALRTYRWPDPDDQRFCGLIYEQAKGHDRNGTEKFLAGSHRSTVWERAYKLVGMEELMCAFKTEPGAVREVLHRIMDFQLGMARHYVANGVELVFMGDDLGCQKSLLLSPQIIEEFLLPEYRRLFDFYKPRGVLIEFHSCGHITPILDIFMDLGIDVLNPVQASANNLAEVRRMTQGRMALHGAISSALLMSGPVEAIRREVRTQLWQLGRGGGYFCGPDQGMPWPREHYEALVQIVAEFGRYPLAAPAG